MAGKVFHVSDEVHARVKAYCDVNNLPRKTWVEEAVTAAMNGHAPPVSVQAIPPPSNGAEEKLAEKDRIIARLRSDLAAAKRSPPAPVEKKPVPMPLEETGSQPWAEPPFWAQKGKSDATEER